MRIAPALRLLCLLSLLTVCAGTFGQTPAGAPPTPPDAPQPQNNQTGQNKPLGPRPAMTPAQEAEALRISKLAIINGKPYDQPSTKDTLIDYAKDTYLLPALARNTARALYGQAVDGPAGWGQDFPGFMQRFGSAYAITAINGNVRLAMELTFHEDLRYLACHGCSVKRKIGNAFLSEVTARHDVDGRRFFTLTPVIADFSGPIIAHSYWYPKGFNPFGGVVATRLVVASRVGQHLFQEFVLERRHHDPHVDR
jgi:hypothetical protein